MRTKYYVTILFLILSALYTYVNCSKVLFVPMLYGSRLFNQIAIGEKLSNLYHHEVHIAVPENQELPFNLTPLYYHVVLNKSLVDSFLTAFINKKLSTIGKIKHLAQFQKIFCDAVLKDHKVIHEMMSRNFDYLLIDSFTQCLYLLPKILKTPYSSCSSFVRSDLPSETGIPLSVMRTPLNPQFSDYSHFSSRIKNFLILNAARLMNDFVNRKMQKDYMLFNKMYLNEDEFTKNEPSDLWIITASSFFMQPTPRSTAVIPVGGALPVFTAEKASEDLLNFIHSSESGIILVSFGSMVNFISPSFTNELLNTFEKLPQYNFIFKTDCSNNPSIPSNVKCVSWMPQIEILNSNLTKLFITHGGSNSMHESASAGVPMLVIPLFGDQFYNAKLIEEKGLGKAVSIKEIKNLKIAILDIINNDSYRLSSVRASQIMRELEPDPAAKAAYFLNHAILYGAEHLRSNVDNLWLYQIYLYDIAAVCLMVISSCIVLLGFILWKCLIRKLPSTKLKDD